MHGPWFFHAPLQIGENPLCDEESRHALGSHRLRPDDDLVLFDGNGNVAQGRLAPIAESGVRRQAAARARVQVEQVVRLGRSRHRLSLIVAGCKGPRLAWMIEKCTELGVGDITLTLFERSVVDPSESRLEKLRKIAVEACKQAHRAWLPAIATGVTLDEALAGAVGGRIYLADPSPDARRAADVLAGAHELAPVDVPAADKTNRGPASAPKAMRIAIVIGPEGGLTPREIEQVVAAGAERVRFGAHILRVETAAIAAAAVWASSEPPDRFGGD